MFQDVVGAKNFVIHVLRPPIQKTIEVQKASNQD